MAVENRLSTNSPHRLLNARSVLPATLLVLLGVAMLAAPAMGYIVYLKDGTQLSTQDKYRIEGDKAYLTMLSGTESVIDASEIDVAKTEEINKVSYGQAKLIEGSKTVQITDRQLVGQPQPETLSQFVKRTGRQLNLPSNAPPPAIPQAEVEGVEVATTAAGFVDLREISRAPYPQEELATELMSYLREQDHEGLGVFQGTRPGFALVDIGTDTEATVFKAMRDCANALVQLREGSGRSLAGLQVLMTASNGVRGGQFTLTPELADILLSGTLKPEAFFLRYVEF